MIIRNYTAAWGWLIIAAFLLMLLLITAIVLFEGTPVGTEPLYIWGILALFWVVGLGTGVWAFNRPLVKLIILSGEIRLLKRTLFKTDKRTYRKDDLLSSEVLETIDTDGDPYFIVRTTFADGFSTDIVEGHYKEKCLQVLDDFRKKMNVH